MNEEYMDIQVYSGDNEEQYVKYGDLLELIERLKIRKEKKDKEIERLNKQYELMEEALEDKAEEIERLNNIIKEVREYIYLNAYDEKRKEVIEDLWVNEIKDILQILDKGE